MQRTAASALVNYLHSDIYTGLCIAKLHIANQQKLSSAQVIQHFRHTVHILYPYADAQRAFRMPSWLKAVSEISVMLGCLAVSRVTHQPNYGNSIAHSPHLQ